MNFMTHVTLANLRRHPKDREQLPLAANEERADEPENKRRGIPDGWGFGLVSCANYLWEICMWFTYAGLTRSPISN